MFCPNCGKQLEDTVKFCDGCGSRVAEEAATTQTAGVTGSKPLVAFNVAGINFSIVKEKIDLIGLIASLVALIALFLPYATVSFWGMSESATFFHDSENGAFVLIALLVYIFCNVFGFTKVKDSIGYVYSVIMIITAIDFASELKKYYGELKDIISYGAGFWLLVITAIVIIAMPILKKFVFKK